MSEKSGDLSLEGLKKILTQAEAEDQTGTLRISRGESEKAFYLEEGRLVFVTSNQAGERIGEFLAATTQLKIDEIKDMIEESRLQGIPFTNYLLAQNKIESWELEETVLQLATLALVDALCWDEGTYRFSEFIPATIRNGPLRLSVSRTVDRAVMLIEAAQAGRSDSKQELLRKIARTIAHRDFEIPPMPDMMVRIHQKIKQDGGDAHDIMKIIMADQILTTKILKIVNSAYYGLPNRVTSLQHAIVYVGFKSIINIVTAHALNSLACKNRAWVREILAHCLKCGFVAKALAIQAGMDEEEMFVCGLLHDIGKTVLLNVLEDYAMTEQTKRAMLDEYHQQAGATLSARWNLSSLIQNVIRHHHTPEQAPYDRKGVELIFLANNLLNNPSEVEQHLARCTLLPVDRLNLEPFLGDHQELDQVIANFI